MGMAAPQDGEQLTKTELSTAQATAAAELALEALKDRDGDELHRALAEAVRTSVSKDKVQERLNKLTSIRRTRPATWLYDGHRIRALSLRTP